MHYLILFNLMGKDQEMPNDKKLSNRNFEKNILFEKTHTFGKKREMLMSAIETIIREKRFNIGKTLHVQLPIWMNVRTMEDFRKFARTERFASRQEIWSALRNAVCTSHLIQDEKLDTSTHGTTDAFLTVSVYCYPAKDESMQYLRKRLPGKEVPRLL